MSKTYLLWYTNGGNYPEEHEEWLLLASPDEDRLAAKMLRLSQRLEKVAADPYLIVGWNFGEYAGEPYRYEYYLSDQFADDISNEFGIRVWYDTGAKFYMTAVNTI